MPLVFVSSQITLFRTVVFNLDLRTHILNKKKGILNFILHYTAFKFYIIINDDDDVTCLGARKDFLAAYLNKLKCTVIRQES